MIRPARRNPAKQILDIVQPLVDREIQQRHAGDDAIESFAGMSPSVAVEIEGIALDDC